jgi:hypothetical protein
MLNVMDIDIQQNTWKLYNASRKENWWVKHKMEMFHEKVQLIMKKIVHKNLITLQLELWNN